MGSRIDQSACKNRGKQVSKSISLLQHTRHDTSGPFRAVFQRCCRGVAVQASHCDTEQSADGEKFVVSLAEACSEFQDDEQDIVDYERPFTAVSVGCDSKGDRADGAEHQHQSDAPCDVRFRPIERFGQAGDCQRDSEEIKGIPAPCYERAEEEQPLLPTEKPQNSDRVLHFVHRRLQSRESGSQIPPGAHLYRRLTSRRKACIVAAVLVVFRRVASFPV